MKKNIAIILTITLVFSCLPLTTFAETTDEDSTETSLIASNEMVPADAEKFCNSYYKIFDLSMSWYEARDYCIEWGGNLVTINDVDEQNFINDLIQNTEKPYLWIGGYLSGENHYWLTGQKIDYFNWAYGEPNNFDSESCWQGTEEVLMIYTGVSEYTLGEWNDTTGDGSGREDDFLENFGFICEWSEKPEQNYIHYSDLFYGYSSYLTQNTYLTGLESNTTNVTTNILNEYITTSHFKASAIFEGIGIGVDLTSVAKYVSDNIGLSNFKFNDELDKANQKFVEELCNVNLNASKEVGAENKYIKNINKFLDAVEKIDKVVIEDEAYYKDLGKPELYDYFVDRAIAVLEEYCTELEPKLPSLKSELYTTLSETTEVLGDLTDAVDFTKSLALSITMQETQMELIQDIINTQSSSSMLYKGMTRLQKQLYGGFVTYFTSTYIEDKVYDKIIGYLPKLTSDAILGGWKSYGSAVTAVVGLVNNIVFKGWLGYDYSEYTSAVMLTQYATDLYNSVRNKASVFSSQFGIGEIKKYETLYNAYITMKSAAFEECKNIAKHNSIHKLEYMDSVSDYFDTENAYHKYIEGVKTFIKAVPKENRKITDFGIWILTEDTIFSCSSDTIEKGHIYSPRVGLKANITINNSGKKLTLTIPKGANVVVDGDLSVGTYYQRDAFLINNGALHITGDLSIPVETSIVDIQITNNGELVVDGSVSVIGWGAIEQSTNDAMFYIGGDFSIKYPSCCKITDGKVVFNGSKQQNVIGLSAYDLEVTNPEGIKYLSNIYLYGQYMLNGNPLENNACYTIFHEGASFGDNSDYKEIFVYDSCSLTSSVKGNITINNSGKKLTLTIPKGANVVVDGDLSVGTYYQRDAFLINNGALHITGDLSIPVETSIVDIQITNNGELVVDGSVSVIGWGAIEQSTNDAMFYIGGDFSIKYPSCCKITDGKVVFNGSKQQTIINFKAPTIVIYNESEEGVIFNSSILPSVLFDHKGNNFTLYNDGSGSTFVDYDGDGIKDNVDPFPLDVNIFGDIDYNKIIDVIDLTYMRKKLLGFSDKNHKFDGIYDVNLDGSVDICDLVAQYNLIN